MCGEQYQGYHQSQTKVPLSLLLPVLKPQLRILQLLITHSKSRQSLTFAAQTQTVPE